MIRFLSLYLIMTIYNVLIPEDKINENGEVEKTYFHRVGTAFPHKKGGGFEPPPLSIRSLGVLRDFKQASSAHAATNAHGDDDIFRTATLTFDERMADQTARALEEADVALVLVDGREGLTAADEHVGARDG